MTIHDFLDWHYGDDGEDALRRFLDAGSDINVRSGPSDESPLHVATRRYRRKAIEILLDAGADIDARTRGGKTAYAHAIRRGFNDLADLFAQRGGTTALNEADRFAVAVVSGRLDEARMILAAHPGVVRTGNPEEDRLLADVAGRNPSEPVAFLIEAGADLTATGLDSGTPLHQAAWFGQPANAKQLIDAGAPLEVFEATHQSSPIGWAVHGSKASGGARERQANYVALVKMFLRAGARLSYPGEPDSDRFYQRLLKDASPEVRQILRTVSPGA